MYPIILVVHLKYVPKMNPKCLPVCELIFLLCTNSNYEVSSCPFALLLIKYHTARHNLPHIIWIFHT